MKETVKASEVAKDASSEMPFFVRSSKFRHVYGSPVRDDQYYKNINITKNAHDATFCAVNPKFLAVVTEAAGGGAFLVLPLSQTGRIDINHPRVTGHRGPVLDIKWNPFNDNEIASCSDDGTVKIWHIPDAGLEENLDEWLVALHGHQRRVGFLEWHPTAENLLLSAGFDHQCILWNVERAEPVSIVTCHRDNIQGMTWSKDGALFATTCKDKLLRVVDPRSARVAVCCKGHQGPKSSKVLFLGDNQHLLTTGFSRTSERQFAVWDVRDVSKPLKMEGIDSSSGVLFPFYDCDTHVLFIAGKGDGNIRYYEMVEDRPYFHYLSEYKSSSPQRGLGMMPKRGTDVTKCEIVRFFKLHASDGICEPISMIVPRKSEIFQEDIYPDTAGATPSLTADEWLSGQNRDPILISMKDGAITLLPSITTYRAMLDEKAPDIIPNKTPELDALIEQLQQPGAFEQPTLDVPKSSYRSPWTAPEAPKLPPTPPERGDSSARLAFVQRLQQEASSNGRKEERTLSAAFVTRTSSTPVTLKKTQSIKLEHDSISGETLDDTPRDADDDPEQQEDWYNGGYRAHYVGLREKFQQHQQQQNQQQQSQAGSTHSLRRSTVAPASFLSPAQSPTEQSPGAAERRFSPEKDMSSPLRYPVKKKVWSPVKPPMGSSTPEEEDPAPGTDPELRRAYFRQLEEMRALKDQLALKDKRIRQLEEELHLARTSMDQSDC